MNKFIEFPHLPDGKVNDVLIDPKTPEKIINSIKKFHIVVHKAYQYDKLPKPVNSHADMQFMPIGGDTAICIPELLSYYKVLFPYMNIMPGKSNTSDEYPNDISYNAFILNKHLFGKLDFIDTTIKVFLSAKGFKLIDINQGYAKCSVCIVDKQSIITADKGIYRTVKELGYDSLLIRPGYINLPGYDYGFIGGCYGKLSKNILCFTGNINLHPDYNLISEFILSKGVSIINLSDEDLIDIGGVIPITETEEYSKE